ncbi:MAG: hypothetical protein JJE39_04040 [Vicinamibacteria bacterium]|nr:hypothetical protein [Vicinamibacteria bacterium]
MSVQVSYLIMFVAIIFLVAFVSYYAWRLASARRQADESAQRLRAFAQREMRPVTPGGVTGEVAMVAPSSPAAGEQSRAYEKRLKLSVVSDSPIFMRRSKAGEVNVQMGERPPMPLKYVLDPIARKALHEINLQATVDLGPSWSIVATEDEQGRLTILRLS